MASRLVLTRKKSVSFVRSRKKCLWLEKWYFDNSGFGAEKKLNKNALGERKKKSLRSRNLS